MMSFYVSYTINLLLSTMKHNLNSHPEKYLQFPLIRSRQLFLSSFLAQLTPPRILASTIRWKNSSWRLVRLSSRRRRNPISGNLNLKFSSGIQLPRDGFNTWAKVRPLQFLVGRETKART